jgi:hypothetical protein
MSLPLSLSLIYQNFLTSISSIDLGVLIFFIGYVCVHLIVLIWIFFSGRFGDIGWGGGI